MIKNIILTGVLWLLLGSTLYAQVKPWLEQNASFNNTPRDPSTVEKPMPLFPGIPLSTSFLNASSIQNFQSLGIPAVSGLRVICDRDSGLPIWIEGSVDGLSGSGMEELGRGYLKTLEPILGPCGEWKVEKEEETYLKLSQWISGYPVYGSEIRIHFREGVPLLLNGRYSPASEAGSLEAVLSSNEALGIAYAVLEQKNVPRSSPPAELISGPPENSELAIYKGHLVWHITLLPNLADRWECFVDAGTGELLHLFNNTCRFHAPPPGPATANATDLLGINRTINTWDEGGDYFLIDASRGDMFNFQQSNFPDDPVGVIWTIDAGNSSWESNNFSASHVFSSNNVWNNPTAVSAHYNGGRAYEYFLNTFDRISINGQGGNIVSLINVADNNGGMDNAFWNGYAMFYGNGATAFKPLARGLDVAGHEMCHGVIQATANLEYFGESGALNESLADVFGAMIDRDDWQIGEDVVQLSAFPSGALRDLSDPNQGGNSLNDPGWQPAHVNEQFTGSADNGGVHINSGIPNRAYYLLAEDIGKDKAEKIFYEALVEYLVKSSKFIDCRLAIVQAATDLHGSNSSEVNAVKSAFDAVGITNGQGGNYQDDLSTNPGQRFVATTDDIGSALFLDDEQGNSIANPLTTVDPVSRPSVTDDGSAMVYVASDGTIRVIFFDWSAQTYEEDILQDEPIWRNVAVSRDGSRIAALMDDYLNEVWVFDFGLNEWEVFELYNPTYTTGIETGDVLYPDILEFDFTGEFVMYDALNHLEGSFGQDIEWWDIGFLGVWNNNANFWGNGGIAKLFSGLPENTSVGNPTFAKNSDYVIALDFIDEFDNIATLLAVNIQTGDQGEIFNNVVLNYPNYTIDDDQLTFDALDQYDNPILAIISLQSNKILPSGNAAFFLDNRSKSVWFADGFRPLAVPEVPLGDAGIRLMPNPASESLRLEFELENAAVFSIEVYDLLGRKLLSKTVEKPAGENVEELELHVIPPGSYLLRVGSVAKRFLKF